MEDQRRGLTENLPPFHLPNEDGVISPGKYFGNTTLNVGHAIIQNRGTCLPRMVRVSQQPAGVFGIMASERP